MKILIVTPDTAVKTRLEVALEEQDPNVLVEHAESGEQAIRMIGKATFDRICVDVPAGREEPFYTHLISLIPNKEVAVICISADPLARDKMQYMGVRRFANTNNFVETASTVLS